MQTLDLHRYLSALGRWSWLLILATALAAAASYLLVQRIPPSFVSTTTLMVGEPTRNPKPGDTDIATAQQLAQTYAQMAQRQPILEATVKALNLSLGWEELRKRVVVVSQRGSQLIEIRAVDTNPMRAKDLAATVARQLVDTSPTASNRLDVEERRDFIREELDVLQTKIQRGKEDLDRGRAALARETSARGVLDRQDEIKALELNLNGWRATYTALLAASGDGSGPNTLTVIEPASLPLEPAGPSVRWNVLLAALAGLVLTAAGVFAMEYFDDTIRTRRDLESLVGGPTLGLIPQFSAPRRGGSPLLILGDPNAPAAEACRALAATLHFGGLSRFGNTVLITSAVHGEGKSTTAANVAAALAQGGKSVLLADLDLRSPSLHALLGTPNQQGAASLLLDPSLELSDCIVNTPLARLKLLPSGPIPPNPTELISRHGEQLVQRLRGLADVVVVDGPPLLVVADATILASLLDGVLVVARSGRTRRELCRATQEQLERAHARVLGTLLNGVPKSEAVPYGYGYHAQRTGILGGHRFDKALPPPGPSTEP